MAFPTHLPGMIKFMDSVVRVAKNHLSRKQIRNEVIPIGVCAIFYRRINHTRFYGVCLYHHESRQR